MVFSFKGNVQKVVQNLSPLYSFHNAPRKRLCQASSEQESLQNQNMFPLSIIPNSTYSFLGQSFLLTCLLITTAVTLEQLYIRFYVFPKRRRELSIQGKIALVSGGSEGIGLSLVQELISQGAAKVYILSRSLQKLQKARNTIKKKNSSQQIELIPCDVAEYDTVKQAIKEHLPPTEQLDFVFINQGLSVPGYLLEQSHREYEKQIKVNYLGGVHLTKVLIPRRNKKTGMHIVYTGSTISFFSCVGFTSYGPSKYAIRSLAESLWSEFLGHSEVEFHLAMPADTKTPGFDEENKTKPPETAEISSVGTCNTSEETASSFVNQVREGRFYITNDLGTYLMFVSAGGMNGERTFPITEIVLSSLLPIPLHLAAWFLASISRKHAPQRAKRFGKVW